MEMEVGLRAGVPEHLPSMAPLSIFWEWEKGIQHKEPLRHCPDLSLTKEGVGGRLMPIPPGGGWTCTGQGP